MRCGIVTEYAAEIAFFGGPVGGVRTGLIGSPESVLGNVESHPAGDPQFYYALKWLNSRIEEVHGPVGPVLGPAIFDYSYERAHAAISTPGLKVSYLARMLHEEEGLVMATPVYVSLTE